MRVLALLLGLLAPSVEAGAWARGAGNVFAAGSLTGGADGLTVALYGEYGFSDRLTFGLDAYIDAEAESATALAFARYSFETPGKAVWALGAGLGAEYRIDTRQQRRVPGGPILTVDHPRLGYLVRLSAHYGRGLATGWIAVDATLDFGRLTSEIDPPLPDVDIRRLKLDATYGWRASERTTFIGQLFSYHDTEDTTFTAALSGQRDMGPVTVELGLLQPLSGGGTQLKLGFSRSF